MASYTEVFQGLSNDGDTYYSVDERTAAANAWFGSNGSKVPNQQEAVEFLGKMYAMPSTVGEPVPDLGNGEAVMSFSSRPKSHEESTEAVVSFSSRPNEESPFCTEVGGHYEDEDEDEDEDDEDTSSFLSDPLSYVASSVPSSSKAVKFNFKVPSGISLEDELKHSRESKAAVTLASAFESLDVSGKDDYNDDDDYEEDYEDEDEDDYEDKYEEKEPLCANGIGSSLKAQFKQKAEKYISENRSQFRNNLAFAFVPSDSALRKALPVVAKSKSGHGFVRAHLASTLNPIKPAQKGNPTALILRTGNNREWRLSSDRSKKNIAILQGSKLQGDYGIGSVDDKSSVRGAPDMFVKYCHLSGEEDTLY